MSMFKPLLASPINEAIVKKHLEKSPLLVSPKLDGIRAINLNGNLVTRSLKPIPNNQVRELFAPFIHLDGELVVGNPADPTAYNRTFRKVMTIDEDTQDVVFWVFDHIESLCLPFVDRFQKLPTTGIVRTLPHVMVKTWDDFVGYKEEFLRQGFEGMMARKMDGVYKCGRSTAKEMILIKIKEEQDDVAEIIDIYEAQENQNEAFTNQLGHTERSTHQENLVGKGMLGGFWVQYKNYAPFKVAPGKLDHDERIDIWNRREEVMRDNLVEFRFFGYGSFTKGGEAGQGAPRFPRALKLRSKLDT